MIRDETMEAAFKAFFERTYGPTLDRDATWRVSWRAFVAGATWGVRRHIKEVMPPRDDEASPTEETSC